jgi:hypothetical protein
MQLLLRLLEQQPNLPVSHDIVAYTALLGKLVIRKRFALIEHSGNLFFFLIPDALRCQRYIDPSFSEPNACPAAITGNLSETGLSALEIITE